MHLPEPPGWRAVRDVTLVGVCATVLAASAVAVPLLWSQWPTIGEHRRRADVIVEIGRTVPALVATERADLAEVLARQPDVPALAAAAERAAADAAARLDRSSRAAILRPIAVALRDGATAAELSVPVTAVLARSELRTDRIADLDTMWAGLVALGADGRRATANADGLDRRPVVERFLGGLRVAHVDAERQLRIVATQLDVRRYEAMLEAAPVTAGEAFAATDGALGAVGSVVGEEFARVAAAEDRRGDDLRTRILTATGALVVLDAAMVRALLRRRGRRRDVAVAMDAYRGRDWLTGYLDAEGLGASLDQRRADGCDAPRGLALCDIDGFAAINARYGRAAGDTVLSHVGWQMRIAAPPDGQPIVARWGADAFVGVVVRPPLDVPAYAASVARRIALAPPTSAGRIAVAASVGAATCTCGRCPLEALVTVAEAALDDARHSGTGAPTVVPCGGPPHAGPVPSGP